MRLPLNSGQKRSYNVCAPTRAQHGPGHPLVVLVVVTTGYHCYHHDKFLNWTFTKKYDEIRSNIWGFEAEMTVVFGTQPLIHGERGPIQYGMLDPALVGFSPCLFKPYMLHLGQSRASFASPTAKALKADRFESVPWQRHMCSTDMLGPAIWWMQKQTSGRPWQMSGRSWRRGWICEMMFSKVLRKVSTQV